jgi:phosphopantetheinyl transferase (holo-ACP synthase)
VPRTRLPAPRSVSKICHSGCFLVGNDIVDLSFFERPGYQHVRYLDRICTQAEAKAVRCSPDPCFTLAQAWAAKEASFKLISKKHGLVHFIPREFVVNLDERSEPSAAGELLVSYGGETILVETAATDQWVHAVARAQEARGMQWRVSEIIGSCGEAIGPVEESAAARRLATELIAELGWEVLSFCSDSRVPEFMRAGRRDREAGVSLSHHGRFAAAAIAWSAQATREFEEVHKPMGEACSICMA